MESDLKQLNSGGSRRGFFTDFLVNLFVPAQFADSSEKGSDLRPPHCRIAAALLLYQFFERILLYMSSSILLEGFFGNGAKTRCTGLTLACPTLQVLLCEPFSVSLKSSYCIKVL